MNGKKVYPKVDLEFVPIYNKLVELFQTRGIRYNEEFLKQFVVSKIVFIKDADKTQRRNSFYRRAEDSSKINVETVKGWAKDFILDYT